MIMRLCEPDGWDDRDGLVGSADAFVVDYGVKRVCALFTRRILRCSSEPSSAMELLYLRQVLPEVVPFIFTPDT